jgi:hypothetical protein
MGEGMSVDGVGGPAPCLDLLRNALGVGRGENTELGKIPVCVGQVIEELGDSLGDTDRGEDAGAEKGVAAEAIVERVLGSGDVRMNPGDVRELFEGEGGDGTFVTFADPFKGEVVAVGVWGVR